MGNRFLRDAILRSDRICGLNDGAQLLFYKLISVVDDFGCFDGRDRVISIAAFPLAAREVTDELKVLHQADAIVRYLNAGKPYIAVMQWGEMTRNYRRKWPAPPLMNDLADLKYRVPFGKGQDQWHNPRGTELVSILLDIHGRPVKPQPAEWRRVDTDMMPIGSVPLDGEKRPKASRTVLRSVDVAQHTQRESSVDAAGDTQRDVPSATQRITRSVQAHEHRTSVLDNTVAVVAAAAEPVPPPPQRPSSATPAAATTTNGGIELKDNGEWHGVSEEQRLRWQAMFDALSIPDQLQRAGQWLVAKPDKRAEYSSVPGGLQSFLINWLLRESRGLKPH